MIFLYIILLVVGHYVINGIKLSPQCGGCEAFEYNATSNKKIFQEIAFNETDCSQTLTCMFLLDNGTKVSRMPPPEDECNMSYINVVLNLTFYDATVKMQCHNGFWYYKNGNKTLEFKNKQMFQCGESRTMAWCSKMENKILPTTTAAPSVNTVSSTLNPFFTTSTKTTLPPQCGNCPPLSCGRTFTEGMKTGHSEINGTACAQTITCYNVQNTSDSMVSLTLGDSLGGKIEVATGMGVPSVKVDVNCSNGQWSTTLLPNTSLSNIYYCETVFFNEDFTDSQEAKKRIAVLEKEVETYKSILAASKCSTCNINGSKPCLNGGICKVLDTTSYVCDCPDDYSGKHCENRLVCGPGDCASNATCTVFNHKKVCTCPIGYTGDKCNIQPVRGCITSDPHYMMFDGSHFDYMGTCPYTITKTFDNSFFLTGYNEFQGAKQYGVSYLTSFELFTLKTNITITASLKLFINGTQHFFPFFYPSSSNPILKLTNAFDRVEIHDNSTGAVIEFKKYQLCISLPQNQLFYGTQRIGGVLGDIDGTCKNDLRLKNGTVLNGVLNMTSCTHGSSLNAALFADSWVTNPKYNNCYLGEVFKNNTPCVVKDAQLQCSPIQDSINGTGPFGRCRNLTTSLIQQYYQDCIFDVCHGYPKCIVLDSFSTTCLGEIPFTKIDEWRDSTNCSTSCPAFSDYSLQTPICQNTCADPNYSNSSTCNDGYQEGCKCWPGYYLDSVGDDVFSYACRRLEDCGCTSDLDGSYYPANTKWLDDKCNVKYHCTNRTIISQPISCSANGYCNLTEVGEMACQCLPGYTGDGYSCTDIDECTDITRCNANLGYGVCINTIGSYACNCSDSRGGNDCNIYRPKRHCADWFVYHGARTNGAFNITIGSKITTAVYCDMESSGGGWTLASHGNSSAGKTYKEYMAGFGNPQNQDVWLGLQNLYLMTNETQTSLRVVIDRCKMNNVPETTRECTYPTFSVLSADVGYSVYIPELCSDGNETIFFGFDGWVRWQEDKIGPVFTTFDSDLTPYNCSYEYKNTGWWYYGDDSGLCGASNLNGLRQACNDDYLQQGYLTWHYDPVKDARMYLRPFGYPNYDKKI